MFGFVNLFKPAGLTSTQAGARLRRLLGDRKLAIGHIGTLDPQAAGVLPISIGKATRLIPLIEDRRKQYVCTLVVGVRTDTGDATGNVLAWSGVPADLRDRLESVLDRFLGKIEQVPPMYSAVHHEGKRLHELARAGVEVVRKPRTISIYGLDILGVEGNAVRLRVACSEGTYIRTLCEDLGRAIGVEAHMGALLREASGAFVLAESRTFEEIEAEPDAAIIAPERVIPIPTVVLDGRAAIDFCAGRLVPLPGGTGEKHVFVRDHARRLVGVGEAVGALLAPRKVFAS